MTPIRRGLFAALVLATQFPLCMPAALAADTTLSPTGLTQVEVGASEDSWGEKLNTNAATINALFDTVTSTPALKITRGGTGGITAAGARTNLGLGTIATLAAPSGSVVGTTDTQTLSNKTLTGPTISGASISGTTIVSGSTYAGAGGTDPINSNAVGWSLSAGGIFAATANGIQSMFLNRTSSDGAIISFYRQALGVGGISVTGSATSYGTSSDYRLKQHVTDAVPAVSLALIDTVRLRDFDWKATGAHDRGVLAHELQAVKPTAVTGVKDGPEMQAVDYSKLVPDLVGAVQALSAANGALAARVAALEAAERR